VSGLCNNRKVEEANSQITFHHPYSSETVMKGRNRVIKTCGRERSKILSDLKYFGLPSIACGLFRSHLAFKVVWRRKDLETEILE
jgi:hypothetical protein